ncbi:glycosyltransferase [Leptolyngbya sp. FACHB-321]|uniref:glycosyltransferase family 2 protein n=1 Tax=Leptolyngbya sp. FACHB-321 TaxID=2692807 RepID=UPI00168396D3|nr:glycosyltransferase family 2 protein [Leptolyngbya sp. FACHB-321]MBD2036626.1 glycosyltransferase [Leptolyngbya sp. FACHB-321]
MLSIITPVYNSERFIATCIEAVIEQNCIDLEHIIIDGDSTDQTVPIIRQYADRYPHIRWHSEPDRGQSDAMNKGIAMASGEIMGLLNVDDGYEPGVLNRVVDRFKVLPEPTLLVGNCNIWDDDGRLVEVNRPAKLSLFELVAGVNIHPYPCNPAAYFYHTALHQKVGLYDIANHYSMDLDFILRAVQAANVVYVDEIWGNYRRLEGTKTVNDMHNGQMNQRVMQLIKHYRKQLPLHQQMQLFGRDFWASMQYFLHKPQALPDAIKAKMLKFSTN